MFSTYLLAQVQINLLKSPNYLSCIFFINHKLIRSHFCQDIKDHILLNDEQET